MLREKITDEFPENRRTLCLCGTITLGDDAKHLRDLVYDAASQKFKKIRLDLERVTSIDSAGIGTLHACSVVANAAVGKLVLMNPSPKFIEILGRLKLLHEFELEYTNKNTPRSTIV